MPDPAPAVLWRGRHALGWQRMPPSPQRKQGSFTSGIFLPLQAAPGREAVVVALTKLAPLYNTLYTAAKAAMVPLPPAAVASIKREAAPPFKYEGVLLAAGEHSHHRRRLSAG